MDITKDYTWASRLVPPLVHNGSSGRTISPFGVQTIFHNPYNSLRKTMYELRHNSFKHVRIVYCYKRFMMKLTTSNKQESTRTHGYQTCWWHDWHVLSWGRTIQAVSAVVNISLFIKNFATVCTRIPMKEYREKKIAKDFKYIRYKIYKIRQTRKRRMDVKEKCYYVIEKKNIEKY